MKIYVLDPFHPAGLEYAAKHFEVIRWDDPRVKNWHDDADGLMVRMTRVTADDIARAKKVRIIGKQGVGYDTVDTAAAKAKGIPVCRTPGVNSEAVAELAIALALAAGRRVAELDRLIRAGAPVARPDFLAVELFEKTVGVVGVGDIGSRVARKWKAAFSARVLGYDPYKSNLPCEQVATLQELLSRSDLVTLHVPLNDETRHMIGARELGQMKQGALIVNTCRGGVIDEGALYDALKAGKLFGAGIDVWEEEEPPRKSHPLLGLPNVVATPHVAGNTFETQARSSMQVATQVVDALQGKPLNPANRVA
ncbi:MAG TPA: NAD(P)-dependent oxidoreductase [Burkholderiales bacterium]|jgi:D-3-phosphoglycerate dehydrogenase|nr:NAD(P)-dependent oxidoreductase [Burkholderiales bacterium]